MQLSPLDIRKQDFERSFRGFDVEEVRAFLSMVANRWEELQDEQRRLEDRVRELRNKMEHYERVEEALQEALQTARESSEERLENAERKATVIIEEARTRADEIRGEARGERDRLYRQVERLVDRRDEVAARLRAFLNSELELLSKFEGGDELVGEGFSPDLLEEEELVEEQEEPAFEQEYWEEDEPVSYQEQEPSEEEPDWKDNAGDLDQELQAISKELQREEGGVEDVDSGTFEAETTPPVTDESAGAVEDVQESLAAVEEAEIADEPEEEFLPPEEALREPMEEAPPAEEPVEPPSAAEPVEEPPAPAPEEEAEPAPPEPAAPEAERRAPRPEPETPEAEEEKSDAGWIVRPVVSNQPRSEQPAEEGVPEETAEPAEPDDPEASTQQFEGLDEEESDELEKIRRILKDLD